MAGRPKLVKTDVDMQRWCAHLVEELSGWPQVTSRLMFGMTAFYRGKKIFATVPRTRAARTPFSVMVKLPGVRHKDLKRGGPGSSWVTFEIDPSREAAGALHWLGRAYLNAKGEGGRGKGDPRK